MERLNTIQTIAVLVPPFVFAVILHEVSHGWIAEKLGDPTARQAGRLTLNPLPHIDLMWTIIMPILLYLTVGFIVGGAKPVPINPYNFKKPRRDMAISSLSGPGINLLMAVSFAVLCRLVLPLFERIIPSAFWDPASLPLKLMLVAGVAINVALAVFNLIPIPPLDGSRVLYWLLPSKQAAWYYRLEPYGIVILMILIYFRVLNVVVMPVIIYLIYILLGQDFFTFLLTYFFKG